MKKYNDILNAHNSFLIRRDDFLKLNYSFFLKLIDEIYEKAELPKDGMIKYKFGTNENINIVEEWLELGDNEVCSMRISLKIINLYHDIKFYSKKVDNNFILTVVIGTFSQEFSFDVVSNKVDDLNFEKIITFIVESIISIYDQSMA